MTRFDAPASFEFTDPLWPSSPRFVEIMNAFEHHYTKKMMYEIRIQYESTALKLGMVEYKTVDRVDLDKMLKNRIK